MVAKHAQRLWESRRPNFSGVTSTPMKIFSLPRSLTIKDVRSCCKRSLITTGIEAVMMISSTYTNINIVSDAVRKIKRDESTLVPIKLRSHSLVLSLENQAHGACFKPYNALCSLHT
jgi:hypothetical protein